MPTGTKPVTADPPSQPVISFVWKTCRPLEAIHELAPGVLAVTGRHGLIHVYFNRARSAPTLATISTFTTPDGVIGMFRIPEGATPLDYAKEILKLNFWFDQPKKLEL